MENNRKRKIYIYICGTPLRTINFNHSKPLCIGKSLQKGSPIMVNYRGSIANLQIQIVRLNMLIDYIFSHAWRNIILN